MSATSGLSSTSAQPRSGYTPTAQARSLATVGHTHGTIVARDEGARHAGVHDTGHDGGLGLLDKFAHATDRGHDDAGAVLVRLVEGGNEHIVCHQVATFKTFVGPEGNPRCGTCNAKGDPVPLHGDSASDVCSIAGPIHRIIVQRLARSLRTRRLPGHVRSRPGGLARSSILNENK